MMHSPRNKGEDVVAGGTAPPGVGSSNSNTNQLSQQQDWNHPGRISGNYLNTTNSLQGGIRSVSMNIGIPIHQQQQYNRGMTRASSASGTGNSGNRMESVSLLERSVENTYGTSSTNMVG